MNQFNHTHAHRRTSAYVHANRVPRTPQLHLESVDFSHIFLVESKYCCATHNRRATHNTHIHSIFLYSQFFHLVCFFLLLCKYQSRSTTYPCVRACTTNYKSVKRNKEEKKLVFFYYYYLFRNNRFLAFELRTQFQINFGVAAQI